MLNSIVNYRKNKSSIVRALRDALHLPFRPIMGACNQGKNGGKIDLQLFARRHSLCNLLSLFKYS
ncbi:hypothetical protein B9X37_10165 [Acinetobacter pittii]|nr:hypothetical protein B9X37_10165 [Acinetobacter pittii]